MMVTDGVTEAMNPQAQCSASRACAAPWRWRLPPAAEHGLRRAGRAARLRGGETQYDDITMVALGVGTSVEDVTTTLPPGYLRTEYFKNVRKDKARKD